MRERIGQIGRISGAGRGRCYGGPQVSHEPRERWYCCNCEAVRELSVHGRCENCDSGQVVSEFALRLRPVRAEIECLSEAKK